MASRVSFWVPSYKISWAQIMIDYKLNRGGTINNAQLNIGYRIVQKQAL